MPSALPSESQRADPWSLAMLRGDFAAAWRICDDVLAARRGVDCSHWPRHLQYVWSGAPLDGRRVLVRCYHGLGDTLQFVRLLAPLRARAAHVSLWVQPALIELLRGVRGADVLLPLHDGQPPIEYDVDIELMELPHALRLSAADLPGPVPYIYERGRNESRQEADAAVQVGLVWRSGEWNAARSIPPIALQALSQIAHVRWCSLQYPGEAPPFPMRDLACRNIREYASNMLGLDLIISVDTMAAHLAGALGAPVWTLLPHECDWRWMSKGSTTPWYPTMRLIRQPRVGDWASVVRNVANALRKLPTRARDIRSVGCTAFSD